MNRKFFIFINIICIIIFLALDNLNPTNNMAAKFTDSITETTIKTTTATPTVKSWRGPITTIITTSKTTHSMRPDSNPPVPRDDSPNCEMSQDLGPLWRRSGFNDFKSWQSYIKNNFTDTNFTRLLQLYSSTRGAWKPPKCRANQSLALIVPFRDRKEHLDLFLKVLHPLLQRQQANYQIFVVEQAGEKGKRFNKGKLHNVGFQMVVSRRPDIDCFIFHDVDLIPEDERNVYYCDENGARHIGAMVDTLSYGYGPIYHQMVGGAIAVTKKQYIAVNGFSNSFWGWGGEDDDFGFRFLSKRIPILREKLNNTIYYYTMLNHESRYPSANDKRFGLLARSKFRYPIDGINSLQKVGYTVLSVIENESFVHIVVDVKNE